MDTRKMADEMKSPENLPVQGIYIRDHGKKIFSSGDKATLTIIGNGGLFKITRTDFVGGEFDCERSWFAFHVGNGLPKKNTDNRDCLIYTGTAVLWLDEFPSGFGVRAEFFVKKSG